MSKFHFFTDYDLLNEQTASEAFGLAGTVSIGGVDMDTYRVTSLHTAVSDAKAYAVCDGTICAQIDTNDESLVNIILKPSQQPSLNFVPIYCYIYKGIKLSSLINVSTMEVSETSTIKVAQSIRSLKESWNKNFDKINNNPPGTTTDKALASAIGLQYQASALAPDQVLDSAPIDELFYRENLNFQLPNVESGWSIGLFDSTSFGLEIIIESISYIPKVRLARQIENTLTVKTLPSSPSQAETFEHWHNKEECLAFMDSAAFFGSMFNSNLTISNSKDKKDEISGNSLYNLVLTSFYNKNKAYIDIRNDFEYSINYYLNMGNNIAVSTNKIDYELINYYSSGWPIYTIISDDFPTGNDSISNELCVRVPKGDRIKTLIYIAQGYIGDIYKEELNIKEKILIPVDFDSDYLEEIKINLFNYGIDSTKLGCGYIRIKTITLEYNPLISKTLVQLRRSSLAFDLPNINNINLLSGKLDCYSLKDLFYVDHDVYSGQRMLCQIAALKLSNKRAYLLFAKEKILSSDFNVINPKVVPFSNISDPDFSLFVSNLFDVNFEYVTLVFGASEIQVTDFYNRGLLSLNKTEKTGNPSDFFIWEFNEDETNAIDDILTAGIFDDKFPVILNTNYVESGIDDNNIRYNKYQIIISGYVLDTSTLKYQLTDENTDIYKYTLYKSKLYETGTMLS